MNAESIFSEPFTFVVVSCDQQNRLATIADEEEKLRADRDAAREKLNDRLAKLEYEAQISD